MIIIITIITINLVSKRAPQAEGSAQLFKLKSEAKKTSVELRKQRRAHGVAAIHASLDRNRGRLFGRAILYTTTAQRGWCIEAFVSILAHL